MRPDRLLATLADMAAGKISEPVKGQVLPSVYEEVRPCAEAWALFARASLHEGERLRAPSALLPPLP